MRAGHRFGQLIEQRLLDFSKLVWIHDLEDVFNFIKEHDFLGAVDFRPISKETQHDLEWTS